MSRIEQLDALEILDSRGRPTVLARCRLASGVQVSASAPSGASTGAAEALELRDGGKRYRGLGCRKAVGHVNQEIAQAVIGQELADQAALDQLMLDLDGTLNKKKLGANAILAVSLVFARAQAAERGLPLYQHYATLLGIEQPRLPTLTVNLFSGGKHAGAQMPIQDILLVPVGADSIDAGLEMIWRTYQAAADLCLSQYEMRALSADEGGLAPPFASVPAAFADTVSAIEAAGLRPGQDLAIAVDVASSHFFQDGKYHLGGEALTPEQMISTVGRWVRDYPIVSVEDGLSEEHWEYWPALRAELNGRALTLGDDFLCTNPKRIERAVQAGACDALLLKVNQIGSLTEAAQAYRLARQAGWKVTISARSGETEDNWLADLSVGWRGDQIKVGSVTQSERLAKYNRLLEIEADAPDLPLCAWPKR